MNGNRNKYLREEYISRINRVQDYIENNISEGFSLKELAKTAGFSPFHFHRIFFTMTGETLFQYIQRVRLEKAAFLLLAHKKRAVTEIALECGFSNQASFAKAFRSYFDMSASKLRTAGSVRPENGGKESNMGKVYSEVICYNKIARSRQYDERRKAVGIPYSVEVISISDMQVAYIRHTGPYKEDAALFGSLFGKLCQWAYAEKLISPAETRFFTLYHDIPEITADDKLRISVCMTVPAHVKGHGEIGRLTVQGGKYAVGHFELREDQYQEAWDAMFDRWLPESGYQPDDRLCFELYLSNGGDAGSKHRVDICVPVKPL